MTDREFLVFIHNRLEHVHGENPLVDYMHRLRAIIAAQPPERESKIIFITNSLEEVNAF